MNNQSEEFTFTKFILFVTKPFGWWIIGQVIVSIVWAVDLSFSPYLIKKIIDVVATESIDTIIISQIWQLALCYITLSVIIVVIFRFYDWVLLKLSSNLKRHIGIIIMQRMLQHSHSFYQNQLVGSVSNKINDVIDHSVNIVKLVVDHFLSHMLALLIAIFTMWYCVGIKFSVALSVWIILFLFISRYLLINATKLTNESAEIKSQVMGRIVDLISNILSINLFNKEKLEIYNLKKDFDRSVIAMQKRDWYFAKIYFFQKCSFIIFQGLCLWWLIIGFASGLIKPGDFALILMLNTSIVKCLWNLSRDLREFTESVGAVIQGMSMIYQPITVKDTANAKNIIISKGEIVFKNVDFYYENNQNLFKNISLCIKAKEKVGIVGYSGSGKSTFIKLILRMHDITGGKIMIDNHDIRSITKSSLRQAIVVITQNPYLFNRSIIENIKFGNEAATDEEAINAAKIVYIDEFINTLQQKYETVVGEHGLSLSGGQRQRIVMARAILKKAPILLLDEAMNQLDSITDKQIQNSLQSIISNTTTIIIAHRLSTLMQMDRILVFDKGKIVQDGKHDELIKLNGLYKELWANCSNGFLPS